MSKIILPPPVVLEDAKPFVDKLSRDLARSASELTDRQARYLADMYLTVQQYRVRAGNQSKAAAKNEEPHQVVAWLGYQYATLEQQMKRALGNYANSHIAGRWARTIPGIGPVLAAGLQIGRAHV